MPHDIFISYSSKDRTKALALETALQAAGYSSWMDASGIDGAASWSKEIANALEECKAVALLLSRDSLASINVTKELAAAAELGKQILPIDLEPIALKGEFLYHLSGLHRIAITEHEAILRALRKMGILAGTPAIVAKLAKIEVKDDPRKSLIVLPFEDLSPAGEDNAWFADGLAGEMIDALGHIKSLRILDRKTSLGLRGAKLRTVGIGKEFNTRYFIEGSVRKFGEQIKISVALLDIETGEYLWQEAHRGEFKDIFDIQEAVAQKVVEGLKLHLTQGEKTLLQERGTEHADAYELYVKGSEYFGRHTKEGYEFAAQLLGEAIKLDPNFAKACGLKANALAQLYRDYDRDPTLLETAMQLIQHALRLKPDLWQAYGPLAHLFFLQGKLTEAEQTAHEYIKHLPDEAGGYFALGFLNYESGRFAEAIPPFEQAVELEPDHLSQLWNLVVACYDVKDFEKLRHWGAFALPRFERHLKLFPDDENRAIEHAGLLVFLGMFDEARQQTKRLGNFTDGTSLYNLACLQCLLKEYPLAFEALRRSILAGYLDTRSMQTLLNDDTDGFGTLAGTQEYEEVKRMVEKIQTEQAAKN